MWWGVSGHRRARFFAKKIPLGRAGSVSSRRSDFVGYAAACVNVYLTGDDADKGFQTNWTLELAEILHEATGPKYKIACKN